jgi:hypothetical protein
MDHRNMFDNQSRLKEHRMEGIFKATAGQSRLEHVAVFLSDGRIGIGFEPHIANSPMLNLSELSEEAQAGFVTFIGEVAKLATSQDEKEIETELIAVVDKAVLAKEALCEATTLK